MGDAMLAPIRTLLPEIAARAEEVEDERRI
jgi:hypothetical protein